MLAHINTHIYVYVFKHLYNSLCPSPIEQGIHRRMDIGSGPLLALSMLFCAFICLCIIFSKEEIPLWKIMCYEYCP